MPPPLPTHLKGMSCAPKSCLPQVQTSEARKSLRTRPDLRRHSRQTQGMASSMTTTTQPKAMMTSTATTLREVPSRQKEPSGFLQLGPSARGRLGFTDVRLCMLTPQVGAPYAWMADCSRRGGGLGKGPQVILEVIRMCFSHSYLQSVLLKVMFPFSRLSGAEPIHFSNC